MRKVAIIQARMSSERLPGKVLLDLAGRTVLERVYDRASLIAGVDEVIVATSSASSDDVLAVFCESRGIGLFRGSLDDVLDRYVQAGRALRADVVIRITADCPFLDPVVSATVLERFLGNPRCDYATNGSPPSYPDGLDTEVVRHGVLEEVWREVTEGPYREHVTLFVSQHPERFVVERVSCHTDLSCNRWTLDEPEDYDMLSKVARELRIRGQSGHLDEILAILADHPEIGRINAGIPRNEGLKRSWDKWDRGRSEGKGKPA